MSCFLMTTSSLYSISNYKFKKIQHFWQPFACFYSPLERQKKQLKLTIFVTILVVCQFCPLTSLLKTKKIQLFFFFFKRVFFLTDLSENLKTIRTGSTGTQRRDELPWFTWQMCTLHNELWMRFQWQERVWPLKHQMRSLDFLQIQWWRLIPLPLPVGGVKLFTPSKEFMTLSREDFLQSPLLHEGQHLIHRTQS